MKKTMKIAGALLLMGIGLASCSDDNDLSAAAGGSGDVLSLSGSISSGESVATRSTAAEQTQFTIGTNVDLFVTSTALPLLQNYTTGATHTGYAKNGALYLKSTDPNGDRLFEIYSDAARTPANQLKAFWPLDATSALSMKAYYPAGLVTDVTKTDIAVKVAADQGAAALTALVTPAGKASDILCAVVTDQTRRPGALPLVFRHLMSKLTVSLVNPYGDATLATQLQGSLVTVGTVTLDGTLNASTAAVTAKTTSPTRATVTVKQSGVTDLTNYCLLPPGQSLRGVEVTVTPTSGPVRTYTIERDLVMEAGKNYHLTLYATANGLTASLTLSPWGDHGQTDAMVTMPLTIEALDAGVSLSFSSEKQYRIYSGGTWGAWQGPAVISGQTLNAGEKIQLIGASQNGGGKFTITGGRVKAYGNIMSLESGYNGSFTSAYATDTEIGHGYPNLFNGCATLVDASGLVLPATTLTNNCYQGMFSGCTSLVYPPKELPAMTLKEHCYESMFYNCTSLVYGPKELPATTLDDYCYRYMFHGCTSLTTAPALLPATTLPSRCYYEMFRNCYSLTKAAAMTVESVDLYCCYGMYERCDVLSNVNGIHLNATTLVEECYYEMFNECWALEEAPELPATTLATRCYANMFRACRTLKSIHCAAAYTTDNNPFGPAGFRWIGDGTSKVDTYGGILYVKSANLASWGSVGAYGDDMKYPSSWTLATY